MPRPAPTAVSEASAPTAPATLLTGNSSLMMPNATGTMPPPTPWITRAMIITVIEEATAASSEPTASAASVSTNTRFLPAMSPIRPRIGVITEADSRYAVSTQVTAACVVCSWCCTVVSTGITSDWSRANAATPSASTPNVTAGRALVTLPSAKGPPKTGISIPLRSLTEAE